METSYAGTLQGVGTLGGFKQRSPTERNGGKDIYFSDKCSPAEAKSLNKWLRHNDYKLLERFSTKIGRELNFSQ